MKILSSFICYMKKSAWTFLTNHLLCSKQKTEPKIYILFTFVVFHIECRQIHFCNMQKWSALRIIPYIPYIFICDIPEPDSNRTQQFWAALRQNRVNLFPRLILQNSFLSSANLILKCWSRFHKNLGTTKTQAKKRQQYSVIINNIQARKNTDNAIYQMKNSNSVQSINKSSSEVND